LTSPNLVVSSMPSGVGHNSVSTSTAASSSETVKFEQKRVTSASKTKVVTDGFSSEQAMANSTEMKRVHTGEMSYQEQSAAAAVRARLEMDGMSAEKSMALKQVSACVAARSKDRPVLLAGEIGTFHQLPQAKAVVTAHFSLSTVLPRVFTVHSSHIFIQFEVCSVLLRVTFGRVINKR